MYQMPAVVFSVLIASVCAVIFYIWQGKTGRDLAAYWVAGVVGFLAGQGVALALGSRILMLGQIHLVEGLLLCVGALFIAKFIKI